MHRIDGLRGLIMKFSWPENHTCIQYIYTKQHNTITAYELIELLCTVMYVITYNGL